jgi:RimJ/RimL family protein N-acetyltransferase
LPNLHETNLPEPLFETERLFIRHFVADDLGDFAALCADSEVMRYVGDGQTLPRSEVARWIRVCGDKYATRGYGTSAVFERASERFIGYCGVVRAPGNDFDELIYVFHRSAWGQGYATEAGRAMLEYVFARSSLSKIYATIYADNYTSRKVADKLGMMMENEITDPDGESVIFYIISRDAFNSKKS